MSSHDPFGGGDSDRTIIKPMPGGRPSPGAQQPPSPQSAPQGMPPPAVSEPISIRGAATNPLLSASAPLFALVSQLRSSVSHPDPAGLQAHVAQEIVNFENAARQGGEPPESVLAARYAICTLVDETALATPWGVESHWASETLLVKFHNEARGGEKFFQILERLLQDPARNLNLLEFYYVCLALGFEGQYRLQPRGLAELEQIRHSVYETVRQFKGNYERDLSLRWQGVEHKRPRLARYVPFWVLGLAGVGICFVVYIGFLIALNVASDPVAGQIGALAAEPVMLERREPVFVAQEVTLTDTLQRDPFIASAIADRRLQIEEVGNRVRVRLWELFASGQSTVADDNVELVERVASGLAQFDGRVRVVGHTDNQPIRSLRYPSNWTLSERRAESVMGQLAGALAPARLSAEGRADTEPVASNDTADGRARNRRIEIELFYEAGEL